MGEFPGWQPDPSGRHQERYFDHAGAPTRLVRNHGFESTDEEWDPAEEGTDAWSGGVNAGVASSASDETRAPTLPWPMPHPYFASAGHMKLGWNEGGFEILKLGVLRDEVDGIFPLSQDGWQQCWEVLVRDYPELAEAARDAISQVQVASDTSAAGPGQASESSMRKWPWIVGAAALTALVAIGAALGLTRGSQPHKESTAARKAPATATTSTTVAIQATTTTAQSGSSPEVTPALPKSFAGGGLPAVHAGPAGRLDVIFIGTPYSEGSDTVVPVEVLNATGGDVSYVDISGPAMSGSTVVGSGDSQHVQPAILAPKEVAFGAVVYHVAALPSGTTFDLSAKASSDLLSVANVKVVQANYAPAGANGGPGVAGSVTNTNSTTIKGPIEADLYCFGPTGAFLSVSSGVAAGGNDLPAGSTGSYSIGIKGPAACTSDFLVGSSGFTY